MDPNKTPFLPAETVQIQRVEIYLQDLKDRLQQLRYKHDEVIQNSVDIIKEIDQVSSTLLLPSGTRSDSPVEENKQNIKKLIDGFEAANSKTLSSNVKPQVIISSVNIQEILKNFEQLNNSQVLRDSLVIFRKAKESLERIDHFFGKFDNLIQPNNSQSDNNIKTNSQLNETQQKVNKVRDKIQLFSQISSIKQNDSNDSQSSSNIMINDLTIERNTDDRLSDDNFSNYKSCSSSLISLGRLAQKMESLQASKASIVTETGYEGDNDDSEYNLLVKRRKLHDQTK